MLNTFAAHCCGTPLEADQLEEHMSAHRARKDFLSGTSHLPIAPHRAPAKARTTMPRLTTVEREWLGATVRISDPELGTGSVGQVWSHAASDIGGPAVWVAVPNVATGEGNVLVRVAVAELEKVCGIREQAVQAPLELEQAGTAAGPGVRVFTLEDILELIA